MALTDERLVALQNDADALRPLVEYLRAEGYTLAAVARLVGAAEPTVVLRNAAMFAMRYGDALEAQRTPLATLTRLLLLGGRVERGLYEHAIPADIRELLESYDLVTAEDDRVDSQITIVEFESLHMLSDRLFVSRGGGDVDVCVSRDVVWPMGEWTLSLYERLTTDPRWKTFLDVGSGSGALSMMVHGRYSETLGIDINPRAVAFANLNASLNGVPDVSFASADCRDFEGSGGYDHIAFTGPSGPVLDDEEYEGSLVAHGGRLGHELLLGFLRDRVPGLLSPAGCCQAWGIFCVQDTHGSLAGLVEESLPDERFRVELEPVMVGGLYLAPQAIARGKLPWNCTYADGPARPRFLEQLRRYQIREVVPAVITVHRAIGD